MYTRYGPPDVLELRDVEKPVPKEHGLLVRVRASTVSAGVLWARSGRHPDSGIFNLILGMKASERR